MARRIWTEKSGRRNEVHNHGTTDRRGGGFLLGDSTTPDAGSHTLKAGEYSANGAVSFDMSEDYISNFIVVSIEESPAQTGRFKAHFADSTRHLCKPLEGLPKPQPQGRDCSGIPSGDRTLNAPFYFAPNISSYLAYLRILLILSGDVERNPGPGGPGKLCSSQGCNKKVRGSRYFKCQMCDNVCHKKEKCSNRNRYDKAPWICCNHGLTPEEKGTKSCCVCPEIIKARTDHLKCLRCDNRIHKKTECSNLSRGELEGINRSTWKCPRCRNNDPEETERREEQNDREAVETEENRRREEETERREAENERRIEELEAAASMQPLQVDAQCNPDEDSATRWVGNE